MSWCNTKSEIPDDKDFYDIVSAFVFNCPSAKKLGSDSKKNVHYESISVRTENGFKSRGINRDLLTTILVQIKKSLDFYRALKKSSENVEDITKEILRNNDFKDPNFIVFLKQGNMSDTETVYYYIRNAFAHGSFEVVDKGNERIYKFENKYRGEIKAQMCLKETTLKWYRELAQMTPAKIKGLRKKSRKNSKT